MSGKAVQKNIREYIDFASFNNTYYILKVIDKDSREITRSFPFLVQIEDNTPLGIPVGIQGNIEKSGSVRLWWEPNTDTDLLGYRVFRSNSGHEEPVEVTRDIITEPLFMDTVNIRVLNKAIYYSVIAVDKNYNTSNYSQTFTLSRPDILPPASAVFTKIELIKDSIVLEWINSVSNDIAKYELIRIEKENTLSRTIKTWYPSQPIEKYHDRSLVPGHTFSYKITVYDSAGNKSETTSREIIFEPGFRKAVTNVKSLVDREAKKVSIQWRNSEPSVKCIIYKKINDNPFTIYKTIEGNIEFFIDQAININNVYSYKIQLVYSKGVKALISEEIKVVY